MREFNISLFFALKAQVQKSVKTVMDGSFRNFGKVSQDGLTCNLFDITAGNMIGFIFKRDLRKKFTKNAER